jgi:dipeptide transport system ATP-binding protein
MNQRVMIAMAVACQPRLLIADEPTTALDVTIQAQILDLLRRLQKEQGMGLIMITHDLGVVAELAQRVAVMYAGQIIETGPAATLFDQPRHPYTAALLAALPERSRGQARLPALPGSVPAGADRPVGCLSRRAAPRPRPTAGPPGPPGKARCAACIPGAAGRGGHGMSEILLEARGLARHYPVRAHWWQKPRLLKALDGVSFRCGPAARWRWWASRAAASPRWRASWR